jgi:hypothetical protein
MNSNPDYSQLPNEEDEIEESIKEDILESSGKEKKNHTDIPTPIIKEANPFTSKTHTNTKQQATPNTILSNKQKLNRGASRDSEYNFNNGTLLNFGLAGQSTRSTFMKTPLMFGQNAHAKLRDIKGGNPSSLYSANNNNMFSPQSGFNRNFNLNKNTVGRAELGQLSPISGQKPNIYIPRMNLHKQIS